MMAGMVYKGRSRPIGAYRVKEKIILHFLLLLLLI